MPVDAAGRLAPDALPPALRDDTALVSVGYANNEVGTVQDAAALAAVAHERGVPVHLDAVQAAGWLPLATTLGADALSIAGPQARRTQGHRGARRPRPHPARTAAARRRAGARPTQRHRGRRRRGRPRHRARARRSGTRQSPPRASRACATNSSAGCSPRCPSARLTGDPVQPPAGHGELHLRGHERRGGPARARTPRRGLVQRIGVRGRQRRALARPRSRWESRPRSRRRRCGSRSRTRRTRAAGCRRRRGRGIRHRRTIGRVTRRPRPPSPSSCRGSTWPRTPQDALDSLRAQTRDDWVAVLVDDASTDGTGAIFDDAAAADPRFRVVHHAVAAGSAPPATRVSTSSRRPSSASSTPTTCSRRARSIGSSAP